MCEATVGVWTWWGPLGGTGLHSGCSNAAELIKITLSHRANRGYLALSLAQEC